MPPTTPRSKTRIQGAPTTPSNIGETPHKHKTPSGIGRVGLRKPSLDPEQIKLGVSKKFKLNYDIDDWQAQTIHKIWSGYDSIMCWNRVEQGKKKKLRAMFINEDNGKLAAAWKKASSGTQNLIYTSPEMALSPRFRVL
ncbi:hypothetical protein M422DRAFT_270572 [Sphaerobolus stellatus SS14]|uniref:Uncharacterized protein n=1 Tax=Sphaerobolus stellatus (strain SS14) TaxID=990650 RepID=A0A0C9UGP7_SPHS4|nr:hypothetical protein M422DRAFT_270572 [Sphaerobolus stellatus SS14]